MSAEEDRPLRGIHSAEATPSDTAPAECSILDTAAFAPIELDELVREAELLSRVDRKYLVPLDVAAEMIAALDPGTRVPGSGASETSPTTPSISTPRITSSTGSPRNDVADVSSCAPAATSTPVDAISR